MEIVQLAVGSAVGLRVHEPYFGARWAPACLVMVDVRLGTAILSSLMGGIVCCILFLLPLIAAR